MREERTPSAWSRHWERLPANARRNIWLGAVVLAVFGLLYFFVASDSDAKKSQRPARDDISREVFTRVNAKDLNLHGLAASVKELQKENAELKTRLEQVQTTRELDSQAQELESDRMLQEQAALMAMSMFEKKYASQLNALDQKAARPQTPAPAAAPQNFAVGAEGGGAGASAIAAADLEWAGKRAPAGPMQVTEGPGGAVPGAKKSSLKMRSIIAEEARAAEEAASKGSAAQKEKAETGEVFLPAGSIFSGTLITGLDAPTGTGARKSPHPALLRVKKEAILPNRYRADVRECFLISGGYGDLASERAYLRAETISCVRNDGGVIEAPIDMYAVGEDGKAGIRGVLDTKQGQFLAKALAAGFLQSVASVFTSSPVPTLATTASDTTPFQKVLSSESVQSAGISGFGSAMDRLANFYIDMAQGVFPIIQIDAGRQVDFIMTRGTALRLR